MCTNQPYISICITTYNGEKFVRQQIDSILKQTLKPFEIIICDDCSTDNTIEILNELRTKEPLLKLFLNETQLGVIKNFEKAISLCTGEFIALSDQDDIWESDKLEKQFFEINNFKYSGQIGIPLLCVHDLAIITMAGKQKEQSLWKKLGDNPVIPNSNITFANKYYGCTMLFNKALKEKILPFPNNLPMHDHWIALNAYGLGKILTVDSTLIKYRRHGNNITSLSNNNSFINRLKIYLNDCFGYEYKRKEIMQVEEFYLRHKYDIIQEYSKMLKTIIKLKKYNNLIRRIYFSTKYRLTK